MNNRYVITFDLSDKNVKEYSEEKPCINYEEISFIHNRLANAVAELDKISLASSVCIDDLQGYNFDVKIFKSPQEESVSNNDEILEKITGNNCQLSISNTKLLSSVARKMYDLKERFTVIFYKDTSPTDSIKKGVESFFNLLSTDHRISYRFQFNHPTESGASSIYKVILELVEKRISPAESLANFRDLTQSLASEVECQYKCLTPEGYNGYCAGSGCLQYPSTCGNYLIITTT